jgi:hypothetical protein
MSESNLPPGWRSYKVKDRPLSQEKERILRLIEQKHLRELVRSRKRHQERGAQG